MIKWIKSLFSFNTPEDCPIVTTYKPWSDTDNRLIMESHMTVGNLADILQRTPDAIRSKRKRLKAASE